MVNSWDANYNLSVEPQPNLKHTEKENPTVVAMAQGWRKGVEIRGYKESGGQDEQPKD